MFVIPPPNTIRRFQYSKVALSILYSTALFYPLSNALAEDFIFDESNKWSNSLSLSSDSNLSGNSYQIQKNGLDSVTTVIFFETKDGKNISVNETKMNIESDSQLSEFTAMKFLGSQSVSLSKNKITVNSGEYKSSINGLQFVTSHQFPWDPPADQSLNIFIQDNQMNVAQGVDTPFLKMISLDQVAGEVSGNKLFVLGGVYTEVVGVDASKIDDSEGTLIIRNNEVKIENSTFRGVSATSTTGSWTGNLADNKLYLKGTNTLVDEYETVFIYAQKADGTHTNRENLQAPLTNALLDVEGILNINQGSSFSMASSHSFWAPVEKNKLRMHDLVINIDPSMTEMNVFAGYSQSNSSIDNTVEIDNVTKTSSKTFNIYAGYSNPDDKYAAATVVKNNSIEVSNVH